MSTCQASYDECVQASHPCFGHKMEYMRSAPVGVFRPSELFRTGTLAEHKDDLVKRARHNGYDPQPVGERWV